MSNGRRVLFIRHGHSVANTMSLSDLAATGMALTDFPLTDRGREQAAITRDFVAARYGQIDAVICSDFIRALQTALIVFPKREMTIDPRLGEINYGVWSRLTDEQIAQQMPDEITRIRTERPYLYRPTGGENWQDAEIRIQAVIDDLKRRTERCIALVGHGHWYNLFERLTESLSIEDVEQKFYARQYIANASVTEFAVDVRNGLSRAGQTEVPWRGLVHV